MSFELIGKIQVRRVTVSSVTGLMSGCLSSFRSVVYFWFAVVCVRSISLAPSKRYGLLSRVLLMDCQVSGWETEGRRVKCSVWYVIRYCFYTFDLSYSPLYFLFLLLLSSISSCYTFFHFLFRFYFLFHLSLLPVANLLPLPSSCSPPASK